MQFSINQNIFKDFPGFQVGIILAINVDNLKKLNEISEFFSSQQNSTKELLKSADLSKNSYITEWQNAYRKFGAKPKDHLSSIENLLKRILKNDNLKNINNLVDLYNAISIKYLLPAGGQDLDKISGNIELTYATDQENPVRLLGEQQERKPEIGEVIYKDKESALVRRWNWKEADRTKLTSETKNAILVLEALPPVSSQMLSQAVNELAYLIEKFCGGSVSCDILNEHHSKIILKKNDQFQSLKPINFNPDKEIKFVSLENNVHESVLNISQEHQIRVAKVEKLRQINIEPWPNGIEVDNNTKQIIDEFKEESTALYTISGRIMSLRLHGKTAFVNIKDNSGKIQVYFKADDIGQDKFELLKDYIDLGDIIWVKGTAFKTKTGEITLKVQDFALVSKCLHPLPDKFHGLEDVEVKYRQRYLDLMTNENSISKFKNRSLIISNIRKFLEGHDFVEVETPMLHPIPGGAAAKPFITHHNALDSQLYLRIAPELYLKRLVVGGMLRVFEINRNFRNEGLSTRHNPEFTMLEFYMANKDYNYAMDLVEQLLQNAALAATGSLQVQYGSNIIDFKNFERISIRNSVLKYGQLKEEDITQQNIDKTLINHSIKATRKDLSIAEKIYLLFETLVESKLIQPTFVTDFPIEISPLAKRDSKNPDIAARFELYIGAMEISNGFNELNDPFDQANRFKQQAQARESGDLEAHYYDADYIQALEYGLPPTAGVGIGIDRLTMLLTNTTSIKDVILFPTLKKKA